MPAGSCSAGRAAEQGHRLEATDMTWIDDCQGDRRYECTYAAWDDPTETWCVDTDTPCWNWEDGGVFVSSVDHGVPDSGGW